MALGLDSLIGRKETDGFKKTIEARRHLLVTPSQPPAFGQPPTQRPEIVRPSLSMRALHVAAQPDGLMQAG